jgi:hypothetical protein
MVHAIAFGMPSQFTSFTPMERPSNVPILGRPHSDGSKRGRDGFSSRSKNSMKPA